MISIAFSRLTNQATVRPAGLAAVAAVLAGLSIVPLDRASAQVCTAEKFAEAVDQSGANLRRILQETQPRLDAKLKQLKAARGWNDADAEEKAYAALSDARMQALERQANELLEKVDQLGQVNAKAPPDCARLQALEAAGLELQAAVRAKATYTLTRIDSLLGTAGALPSAAPATLPAATAPKSSAAPPKAPASETPAPPPATKQQSASAATPPSPATPSQPPPPAAALPSPQPWSTTTTVDPDPPGVRSDDGYTVQEIMLTSTGFFGKVSAGLGSIIEHAFSSAGRPSGYILGTEGGGAFLAGLRYGSGTLYMRSGGTMPIHWHGPSLGTDIGASGSKVMFLIYRLNEPEQLQNAFTGVEGSAFVVGGVGFTLLTNGDVQMAPIRSGLGLRVGASVGYLRFTRKPTWNPF